MVHLLHGTWLLCTFSQLKVSYRCLKSKQMVSWGSCVLEAETCVQMMWFPDQNPVHRSLPWVLAALASWTPSYHRFKVSLQSGTTQSGPGWMPCLKDTARCPMGGLVCMKYVLHAELAFSSGPGLYLGWSVPCFLPWEVSSMAGGRDTKLDACSGVC